MKIANFSNMFLTASRMAVAMVSVMVCYPLAAHADAPSPETFNKPAELVLTLSDNWLQPDKQASFKTSNTGDGKQIIANKLKKPPVKVDCGMDVNQNASIDNSLSNRLTGECELHYSY